MRHIWPDYLQPGLASIPHILAWPFQKFTIIAALSQNHKLKSERPKVIMERSRWKTAGNCVIHLLPLAVIIALLALNFSQVYAGDVGASNPSAKLNALQFAAKLHEVLMAASLSSIVLHCVQYELLHGEGVPLGGLLAGFQVTDLGSLWSPGLWAITFVEGEKFRRVLLAMLVATLVILVAIVGPSSAILMLPSLDWWEYQYTAFEGYPYTNNEVRIFIGANESTLWPRHITLENFHPLECNSTNDTVPFCCPLGAFSTLLDLASPDVVISSKWTDPPNYWNITLPFDIDAGSFSQYVEGAYGELWLEGEIHSWLVALTQTTPLTADILLANVQNEFGGGGLGTWSDSMIFKISLKNNSLIPAPSTQATCSDEWYKWENGTLVNENSGPLELVFPLNNGSPRWSAPSPQLFDVWNNSTEYAAAWVEAPDIGADSPSIGVVFALFGNFSNGNYTDTSRYDAKLSCCSVVSSWEPVQIYTNPKTDTYFHSPTVDNAPNTDSAYLAGFEAIKFDLDWAESAIPANETLVPLHLKLTGQENLGSWTIEFPIAVSILVTTVLSRIGANISDIITGNLIQPGLISGNLIMNRSDDGNAGDWTEFKVAVLRYGYGYSMRGLTRRLATGILLTYLLIVVVYLVIILWSGWSCIGLKSLVEMLALAVNSTPTTILSNTSAGISRFDTYKNVVKVRVVTEHHLGIVFDGDMSADEVEEGERYG
jgi:hypothetical protein